jgi:AraC family transcriptional regulator
MKTIFSAAGVRSCERFDSVPDDPVEGAGLTHEQIGVVFNYIELHLEFETQVPHLAMLIGRSACYFSRVFKLRVGMGPAHYVRVRRIERAKRMMLETSESLAQIAAACGFSDQPHLTRVFRCHVGISPGEWRRGRFSHPVPAAGAK